MESIEAEGLLRRIKLLPWQPDDMTHLSYEQMEEDESFFLVCLQNLKSHFSCNYGSFSKFLCNVPILRRFHWEL